MFEDFQLAAIVRQSSRTRLLRIPLHQTLQDTLAENWQSQYETFVERQEVDFDAGYKPEAHELFRLKDYTLPDWLASENSQTAANLDAISKNEKLLDSIKGIVAFVRIYQGEELMLFQNFSRSHVIRPGRLLLLQHNTYVSVKRAGLTLDAKLSAVYLPAENKLLFRNFRTTNTFLPLTDFYKEASDQEIRDLLNHDRLAPEDPEALVVNANQWFRKRFAMLRDSGILDEYTAEEIVERSSGYDIHVALDDGKIIFPADRAKAKRLLQFLNEEVFRGAITEKLYETNSKREAD